MSIIALYDEPYQQAKKLEQKMKNFIWPASLEHTSWKKKNAEGRNNNTLAD